MPTPSRRQRIFVAPGDCDIGADLCKLLLSATRIYPRACTPEVVAAVSTVGSNPSLPEQPSSRLPASTLADLGANVLELPPPAPGTPGSQAPPALRAALHGAATLVLVLGGPGSEPARRDAVAAWGYDYLNAANAEGVGRVVLMTVADAPVGIGGVREEEDGSGSGGRKVLEGGSFRTQFHAIERHLSSLFPADRATVVRASPPGVFFDSLTLFAEGVADNDELAIPAREEDEIPFIDLPDVTRFLLRLLVGPALPAPLKPHPGPRAYTLLPPRAYTGPQAAAVLSARLGRPVRFRALADSADLAGAEGGVRELSSMLAEGFRLVREGRGVARPAGTSGGDLERATGEAGRSLEEWVCENAGAFGERERRELESGGPLEGVFAYTGGRTEDVPEGIGRE